MTGHAFKGAFLRQCATASALIAGLGCVAERILPGVVLANTGLAFYGIVIFAVVCSVLAPPVFVRARWLRALALVPVGFLLVAFVFLITSDLGRTGLVLSLTAVLLTGMIILALALRPPGETEPIS
ncbi:MAG: hypothetical protein WCV84_00760 [Patescibacteria group bacterium]